MSVEAPAADEDVAGFCRDLGIPGLVDIHTHFMPVAMRDKVRAFFDGVQLPHGGGWPLHYRDDDDLLVARLRSMGVRAFTALSYPHKPGMATWLNGWSAAFAGAVDGCVPSATFFPEPEADAYVAAAIEGGVRVFKVHLQVGGYDPRDPLLTPVWRRIAAARIPVVTHAGSGPAPGAFTGVGPFGEVLAAHPDLVAVVAHMGATEYDAFLDLALEYPNVHLDTTMAFTDFLGRFGGYPPDRVADLAEIPERIVLGTDFPNIPYPYAHQIEALVRLGLGDDWLRAVCHDNGARLLGLPPSAT